MKYLYHGKLYEMIDYNDDTETNSENNELIRLGLIFGNPIYNGSGIEVEYKGTKIIVTPTSFNRILNPEEKNKKKRQYQKVPAYMITAGNQGATVDKTKANLILRSLKARIDNSQGKMALEEGFFSTMLKVGSDVALKGMGFGELPGQGKEVIRHNEEKKNAHRK